MATVYYWAKRKKPFRIGHLSMELDDGTYISHWPGDKSKLIIVNKSGMVHHTLAADKLEEGGDPNEIVKVPAELVNIAKIKQWWQAMKENGTNYNLWKDNCGQMVLKALQEGELSTFFAIYDQSDPIYLITPYQALKLIKSEIESVIGFLEGMSFLDPFNHKKYVKQIVNDSNVCTTRYL